MHKYLTTMLVGVILFSAGQLFAQPSGSFERPDDWQVGFFISHLTDETLMETKVGGEPVTAKVDSSVAVGLRAGLDHEYSGIEGSFLVGFSDLELKADPAAGLSDGDADLYLANLNFFWYPGGNELDEGRFRPFLTAGPGLGFYDSDFGPVDGELLYDVNFGAGFKFLTGDEGNPVIRFDWRWHIMKDFDDNFEWMYRQELSLGVGIRF